MLQKIKRLLVVGVAALALTFAVPMMANAGPPVKGPPGYYQKVHGNNAGVIKYFPNGHPENQSEWQYMEQGCSSCDDAFAHSEFSAHIGFPAVIDSKTMGWSAAGGDLNLEASATATGESWSFWIFHHEGEAYALAVIENTTLETFAIVISNGEKLDTGGLSFTSVTGMAVLDLNASAYAEGDRGCLQIASARLSGDFSVEAGGHAKSTGPNGSFSQTWASGVTTAGIEASAYDDNLWFGFLPLGDSASVELDGKVIGIQGLFVKAYTSPDGQTTRNYGIISGGNVIAFGDIDLTGDVTASGIVQQQAQAVGPGASVSGYSMASYANAGGNVSGRWLPSAQADGLAIVTGYNNITNTGGKLTINSRQTAYATTK